MGHAKSSPRPRRLVFALVIPIAAGFAVSSALPLAQTPARKAMTVEDYPKWRSIAGAEMSGDGNWAAYTLQLTNTIAAEAKPVLHLENLVGVAGERSRPADME